MTTEDTINIGDITFNLRPDRVDILVGGVYTKYVKRSRWEEIKNLTERVENESFRAVENGYREITDGDYARHRTETFIQCGDIRIAIPSKISTVEIPRSFYVSTDSFYL
jgi:hypothetical protein